MRSRPTRASSTCRGTLPLRKPGIFKLVARSEAACSTACFTWSLGTSTWSRTRLSGSSSTVVFTVGPFCQQGFGLGLRLTYLQRLRRRPSRAARRSAALGDRGARRAEMGGPCAPARSSASRAAAAGLVTQSSVAFALFLPFVLAGEFRMFDYRWQVNGDTLLGLFVEPGTPFYAVWLAPLAVVVVRLSLDPVRYPWYWVAPEALALLGAAELLGGDALRSLRARRLEPRPRS